VTVSNHVERYVALLRGINVGGHNVKMEKLRAIFEVNGFTDVSTFIASGNILFAYDPSHESDLSDPSDQHRPPNTPSGPRERRIESRIEAQLEAGLGFKVATFVRSMSEMEAVATCKPFPSEKLEKEGSSLFVAFLRGAASEEARSRVIALGSETDSFHFHARELYWWTRANMSASPLFAGSRVEKALGELSTTRNITTVRKLAALCAAPEPALAVPKRAKTR